MRKLLQRYRPCGSAPVVVHCKRQFTTTSTTADDDDDELVRMLSMNLPPPPRRPPVPLSNPTVPSQGIPCEPPPGPPKAAPLTKGPTAAVVPGSSGEKSAHLLKLIQDYKEVGKYFVRTRTRGVDTGSMTIEWLCIKCMNYNPETARRCVSCFTEVRRSKKMLFPPVMHRPAIPESWWCRSCKVENKATPGRDLDPLASRAHFTCTKCNKETFAGLQPWHCSHCFLLNPKVAVKCESCAEPRAVVWSCTKCLSTSCIFTRSCADCGAPREVNESSLDHLVKCCCCGELNGATWEICSSCAAPLPVMAAVARKILGSQKWQQHSEPSKNELLTRRLKTQEGGSQKPSSTSSSLSLSDFNGLRPPSPQNISKWMCPICFALNVQGEKKCVTCSYVPVQAAGGYSAASAQSPSTWSCDSCGGVNARSTRECTVCGEVGPSPPPPEPLGPAPAAAAVPSQEKLVAVASPPTVSPAAPTGTGNPLRPGEWLCHKCSGKNSPLTQRCLSCSSMRVIVPGYWQCFKCFSVNKNIREVCVGCYTQRPQLRDSKPAAAAAAEGPSEENPAKHSWRCKECSRMNSPGQFECYFCGRDGEQPWACPGCSASNSPGSTACASCGFAKPIADQWSCLLCRTWNIGSVCARCTTPRSPHTVEVISSKWDCSACAHRNKSTSPFCSKCSSPRVLAKLTLTLSCNSCSKIVDVGPSELCNNCQGSVSRQVSELLRNSLSLARVKLPSSGGGSTNDDPSKHSEIRRASGGSNTVVPPPPAEPAISEGEECLDVVEAKPPIMSPRQDGDQGDSDGNDAVNAAKTDGNLVEDPAVEDDDEELLQSFVHAEQGSIAEVKGLVDQFWTCSLCAAKNLEGAVECMVCGIRKGDD